MLPIHIFKPRYSFQTILKYRYLGTIFIIAFFLTTPVLVFSQDLSFFSKYITEKELELTKTAFNNKQKADELIGEISALNQEYFKLEADYNLSQKQFEKKTKKIEGDIENIRKKAFKLYKESNSTIFNSLNKAIDNAEELDQETLELTRDFAKKEFEKASDLRNSAYNKTNEFEVLEELSLANESEQKAIDALTQLLKGETIEELEETPIADISPSLPLSNKSSIENTTDVAVTTTGNATIELPEETILIESELTNKRPKEVKTVTTNDPINLPEKPNATYNTQNANIPIAIPKNDTLAQNQTQTEEFTSTKDISGTTSPTSQNDPTIDKNIVDKYQQYINNDNIPEPITIYNANLNDSALTTQELAQQYWTGYQESNIVPPNSYQQTENVPNNHQKAKKPTELHPGDITENKNIAVNNKMQDTASLALLEEVKTEITSPLAENTVADNKPTDLKHEAPVSSKSKQQTASQVESIYRIQIAANKKPLDNRSLQAIYYGNKKVGMTSEGGWYKYSIGDFNSFAEADAFRNKSGLKNGFIVKYTKNTSFNNVGGGQTVAEKPPVISTTETVKPEPNITTTNTPAEKTKTGIDLGIKFRVQIAASKIILSHLQFNNIYKGNASILIIKEDNWYKYQSIGFNSYREAKIFKQNCNVKNAFIVAYNKNIKTNLKDAIKATRHIQETYAGEIVFMVQIAASKYQLKSNVLQTLNPYNYPVHVLIEEGWYKYQVFAGDYNNAMLLKQSFNSDQVFIVAYNRSVKMKLYKAIKATR